MEGGSSSRQTYIDHIPNDALDYSRCALCRPYVAMGLHGPKIFKDQTQIHSNMLVLLWQATKMKTETCSAYYDDTQGLGPKPLALDLLPKAHLVNTFASSLVCPRNSLAQKVSQLSPPNRLAILVSKNIVCLGHSSLVLLGSRHPPSCHKHAGRVFLQLVASKQTC